MGTDLKYDDKILTLTEVLSTTRLPEVLRICGGKDFSQKQTQYLYHSFIQQGTEILLQQRQKVKYAHICVLKFYDNAVAEEKQGAEYVLEHETFVGKDFLIPVNYRGTLRFTHRPGSWRRFASVAQLLETTPRYVKVGEEVKALNAKDLDKQVYIPANIVLEVVQEFHRPPNDATYLELTDGTASYAFSETDFVNFTEVEDPKQYHLFELIRFKMLPKAVLFDKIPLEDAILVDKEFNSGMMTSLDGPVDLLGFVDVEHLIGWVRDKQAKVYRTVLIPQTAWNTVLVQKRIFLQDSDRDKYITRKYGPCKSTDFVDKCMYWMPLDQTQVTWLRNPEYYAPSGREDEFYQHLPIEFPVSSDDESCEYTEIEEHPEPAPAVLYRRRKSLPCDQPKLRKQKFGPKWFKKLWHKGKQDDQTQPLPPKPATLLRSYSDEPRNVELSKKPDEQHYDYAENRMTAIFKQSLSNAGSTSGERPLLQIPDTGERPLLQRPDTGAELQTDKKEPNYVSIESREMEHLLRGNQATDDFLNYSVAEVASCSKECGLSDFGNKCLEKGFDGKYFKNFDLNKLKNEPFNLTHFQMVKVTKMIKEGWRPNVGTDDSDKEQTRF